MTGKLVTIAGILITVVILFSVAAPTIQAFADKFSLLLSF